MRFRQVGNRHEIIAGVIQNDESSITIKQGGPVFIKPDGSYRKSVVSAETLAAARQPFFFGFALNDVVPGADAEAIMFGLYDYARVLLTTRAASTDVWASYSAGAIGDIMAIATAAGIQGVVRTGAGSASVQGWDVILGTTYASQTTQASSNGLQSLTYWTTQLRVLIRRL